MGEIVFKTGFWQVIVLLTIIYSFYISITKHGEPVISRESQDEWNNHSEGLKVSTMWFVFFIWLFAGPFVAYMGGCSGGWYLGYTAVSFGFYLSAMHTINSGNGTNKKHSIFRSVWQQGLLNFLLYMGGFWTVTN